MAPSARAPARSAHTASLGLITTKSTGTSRTLAILRTVSRNQGGIEKSRMTSYPAIAYGTAAAVIAVMMTLKFFCGPRPAAPLAMKNQNLSPSMLAVGPGEQATSSRAMVVLPAPTGPERRTIDFTKRPQAHHSAAFGFCDDGIDRSKPRGYITSEFCFRKTHGLCLQQRF